MTKVRNQKSEIRSGKLGIKAQDLVFLFLISGFWFLISGCTFFRPPGHGLPDRGTIQVGGEVTVERNQNVYSIAREHGVSMREVIVLNDLKPPFIIHPGQKLLLPAKDKDSAPAPSAAPLPPVEKKSADTYTSPLDKHGTITSVPIEPPQKQPEKSVQFVPEKPFEQKPAVTTVMAEPQKHSQEADRSSSTSPRPEIDFTWPVQGPIVSAFGSKGRGVNNDGINIAAPKGSPVLAAAGGIVVYAGNEMKGFGNLILIRHEGGWVTAYAHLDRMMVARDTVVAPGDMIGTVGSTGGVATPQLHFETRHEGKPVDPQTVIKKS